MRPRILSTSRPRPSDPSRELATFRLFPGALARQDRELAWAHALEREEALRALHARGATLALEVHLDRSGAGTLSLLTRLEHRAAVMALWGPRILPWSWSLSPSAPSPPPPGSLIGTIGAATARATSAPMRSSRSERSISPWTLLLPSLRGPRREVRIRFVARPVGPSAPAATPRALHLPRGDRDTPLPLPPAHRLEREMEDLRGERAPGPYWECGGALAITGPGGNTPTKEEQHAVSSLWGAISGVPGGGSFQVRWVRGEGGLRKWEATTRLDLPKDWFRVLGFGQAPALVTPAELMLWLPPWDARRTPGLRSLPSTGTRDLHVGTDPAGERVGWSLTRGEGHHLTVAGETGMGKSTLLQRLAADAMGDGRTSLIVVDPLGETAQGVLHLLSPAARSRSVWVAPLRSPVGINALELPTGLTGANARAERERRVSELVTALRRVRAERYGETFYWGPRIEDLLTRTFLVLSACPGSTLRDAHELLSEPDRWVGPLSSEDEGGKEALALWESIRREGPEERQGALRIVQEVALSSAISRLLATRAPRWSLSRALEPGAVTFFDLERTAIGVRASSYLGAALLSLLWSFLLARKDRGKVLLILDEVQEFLVQS
ncbi:MAG: hypothetical protein KGI98_03745 [Euryarchaeota archaeon]|nr:hypothetical protein [Euryarchaeota archaeon]MDE1880629.1 hypothetical protein [Euryarchaeota archaeon]